MPKAPLASNNNGKPMSNTILHLVPAAYFQSLPASQSYLPESFAADGFIHCTREPEVMFDIANRFYKNLPGDVLVLVIDADQVTSKIKWELPADPDGAPTQPEAGRLFPHIYGPLNRDAIVAIRRANRSPDGTFLSI